MMTEDERTQLISELRDIANHPQWGLVRVDVDAIRVALSEIKRLTRENADLKTKLERESTENLTKTIAAMAVINVEKETEIKRLIENNWKMQSKLDSWTQELSMRDWVTRDLVEE